LPIGQARLPGPSLDLVEAVSQQLRQAGLTRIPGDVTCTE